MRLSEVNCSEVNCSEVKCSEVKCSEGFRSLRRPSKVM